MPEASVTKGGPPSKGTGGTGRERGTQTPRTALADWWFVVLTCPDGRVIKLGYDQTTCYEVAASFAHTKVKARVVMEKVKYAL